MPRISLTPDELTSMRSRLCAAALDIFREQGIEAVTFRALAEALGISHTLPYRYFDSKDALLASVRVLCFQRFEAFVAQHEPADAATVDRVRAVIDAFVRFVEQHPVEYTLMFASQQPPPLRFPELLAARRSLFEHCVDLMQGCVDEGLVEGEARQLAHMIWGVVHGLLTLHVANQLVHGYELQALVMPAIHRIMGLPMPMPERRTGSRSAVIKPVAVRKSTKPRHPRARAPAPRKRVAP